MEEIRSDMRRTLGRGKLHLLSEAGELGVGSLHIAISRCPEIRQVGLYPSARFLGRIPITNRLHTELRIHPVSSTDVDFKGLTLASNLTSISFLFLSRPLILTRKNGGAFPFPFPLPT